MGPLRIAATLAGLIACSLSGLSCDDAKKGGAPVGRDEVITATGSEQKAAPTPAATTPPPRRGKLCNAGKPGIKPKALKLASVQAPDETPLSEDLTVGDGAWTWINIWAGWCEPCLEEIPMLASWQSKLGGKLRVEFVSIDDDERQAVKFLSSQPKGGVRRSHHIPDPKDRNDWLSSMGASLARLPIHILVDPAGEVRCTVNGAITAQDFAEVEGLVRGAK